MTDDVLGDIKKTKSLLKKRIIEENKKRKLELIRKNKLKLLRKRLRSSDKSLGKTFGGSIINAYKGFGKKGKTYHKK